MTLGKHKQEFATQHQMDQSDPVPSPKAMRTQKMLVNSKVSQLEKYRRLVTGPVGFFGIVKYEIIISLMGWIPGILGLVLRRFFYKWVLKAMGKGVIIGRGVTIRHPGRIAIGDRVVISDGVVLDAKGETGQGIVIQDDVFIGNSTILSTKGGTIEVGEGTSINSFCRIGSIGPIRIGRKVLIAAYVYIIGGDHQSERVDIPIIDQPADTQGGVEVGDGCWLGAFTAVMDGVTIGHDAIIGAHSLVTKNIPSFALAYGVPARVIRDRRQPLKR